MIFSEKETLNFTQYTFAYLICENSNHHFRITLNRPAQKNALNEVLLNELAFALSYAHYNSNIRVISIHANGSVFCAGADLKTFMGQKDLDSGSNVPQCKEKIVLGNLFSALHKPCIAVLDKPVYAGGFLILTGCTHVICTTNATFTLSEVKRGIWPFQVMAGLLKVMSDRKALDWCLQGKTYAAQEALEAGLVTQVVDLESLDEVLKQLVQKITENSPTAIMHGLSAYQKLANIAAADQHDFLHNELMQLIQTEDAIEGMMAFREKRKPNWKG